MKDEVQVADIQDLQDGTRADRYRWSYYFLGPYKYGRKYMGNWAKGPPIKWSNPTYNW